MSVLETAIGWLTPPQCVSCQAEGLALCATCSTTGIVSYGGRCWRCDRISQHGRTCPVCRHLDGPHSVWISTNYEEIAAAIVRLYKFGQLRAAAEPLARIMAETFLEFNDEDTVKMMDYVIVPVPTATSRARQRGFDHSALLARSLSRKLGLRRAGALSRLGQTRQLGSLRAKRLAQLSGSFYVNRSSQVTGRNILLIDDVITTGGTIIEATKALKAAGAHRVDALIFAKRL